MSQHPIIEPPASSLSGKPSAYRRMKIRILSICALWLSFAFVSHAQNGPGFALQFDGVDDFMYIGAAPVPVPWTAEFWVKREKAIDNSAILLGDASTALKLEQFLNTRLVGFTQFGVADYTFNYTAPTGTWVHLAFVSDTSTRLYVNGALQDTNAATISLPLGQLGSDISNRYYNHLKGSIDEVRVWNIARSQSQIQANLGRSLVTPQNNLIAYWHFDEGSGTTTTDSSGQGRTGTLVNGPLWVNVPLASAATIIAFAVTTNSTTLGGLVNPNGSSTTAFFEWGTNTNYGNTTTPINVGGGNGDILVVQPISTDENFVYHFRVVAFNSPSAVFGDDISFRTPRRPDYSTAYTFATLAGLASSGSADGVGTDARFLQPAGIARDGGGNLYVADYLNYTIRKVTSSGAVSTIAGTAGIFGSADGTNSKAHFGALNNGPAGLAVDSSGQHVYVADMGNNTIRMLTAVGGNWVVSTIAGLAGNPGNADGINSVARFDGPSAVAVSSGGDVFVADFNNHTIRWLTGSGTNWLVRTIAGLAGAPGSSNGSFSAARFFSPDGIAVDGVGNVLVSDTLNGTIRKLTPLDVSDYTDGSVSTIVGTAGTFGSSDGTGPAASFGRIANVYSLNTFPGDPIASPGTPYNGPEGIAVDSGGNLYVADSINNTIRNVTPPGTDWVVGTWAGLASVASGSKDATGNSARFNNPASVTADSAGNVYVADRFNNSIRKINSARVVSTIAGLSGSSGSTDGNGSIARFNRPRGVAVDNAGNVYVADTLNATIRQINASGVVTTLAGSPQNPGSSDNTGSDAQFNFPSGIAVDSAGNIYVADSTNSTIRKITQAGVTTTVAGLAGNRGSTDSPARFNGPMGIAVDSATNLYVADTGNATIRKIQPSGGSWVVSTVAGLAGSFGSADGSGSNARFGHFVYGGPQGVAVDQSGNVYVADTGNGLIRKITPAGVVSRIAGGPYYYGNGDGPATNAQFELPAGIAIDVAGNLWVADSFNANIRKLIPDGTNWIVRTIGGLAQASGSADGVGGDARFNGPMGIAVDNAGSIFVADTLNNSIRKGVFTTYGPANPAPYNAPTMSGQLQVFLIPTNAHGQWRLPWELAWRNSGDVATNLVAGEYTVQFREVPGWLAIPLSSVTVTNGGTIPLTNQYYPTLSSPDTNSGGGSLTVNIGPSPPPGAGWHFIGDTTPPFPSGYPPGFTTNLQAGTYLIEFASISNYAKPPSLSIAVAAGAPTVISVNYTLAAARPGLASFPFPVPPARINDPANYPFGFNGQLQTDIGYGSGVLVQPDVVLTAAHVVFNDQTKSYVSQAFWYLRQEAGSYSPTPRSVRGGYVLSGYASQRTNDLAHGYNVDQSSAASRNLDVAALYFPAPASQTPWSGYGGYLPSDVTPNPWLTGLSSKMLVGYPVDGSFFGDAITNGLMYQTEPQLFALNLSPEQIDNQQIYTSSNFLSYPGNSGGPFYVEFNGYFYPAGVYLGTLFNGSSYQSVVRAIDSQVVNLITNAAALVSGTNNTGGGVITFIYNGNLSATNPAYLQVVLGPPAAVQAGAGWRLLGDSSDSSYGTDPNYTRAVTTNGASIEFKQVDGWNPPPPTVIQLTPGAITRTNLSYTVVPPVMWLAAGTGLAMTGTINTSYRVERRPDLLTGSWLAVSTNTLSNGFSLLLTWPFTNGSASFYRAVWLP